MTKEDEPCPILERALEAWRFAATLNLKPTHWKAGELEMAQLSGLRMNLRDRESPDQFKLLGFPSGPTSAKEPATSDSAQKTAPLGSEPMNDLSNDPLFRRVFTQELMERTGKLMNDRAALEHQWVDSSPPTDSASVYWYRVNDHHRGDGYFDESGDYCPSSGRSVQIVITAYKVLATTPKGVWLSHGWSSSDRRWVSSTSCKRFAYPTLEEAWASFQARKQQQARICEAQLTAARKARKLAELPLAEALSALELMPREEWSKSAAQRLGYLSDAQYSVRQHYSGRVDTTDRYLGL